MKSSIGDTIFQNILQNHFLICLLIQMQIDFKSLKDQILSAYGSSIPVLGENWA